MKTAVLYTRAPQAPSLALDIYRKGMRAQMRQAHAAGVAWFARQISIARDVPDMQHLRLMQRAAEPTPVDVEDAFGAHWTAARKAEQRIARACVDMMVAYLATLPLVPRRQPASGEKFATYPRNRTIRNRERRRAQKRLRERGAPEAPEPVTPKPCAMWRTRPARAHLVARAEVLP